MLSFHIISMQSQNVYARVGEEIDCRSIKKKNLVVYLSAIVIIMLHNSSNNKPSKIQWLTDTVFLTHKTAS